MDIEPDVIAVLHLSAAIKPFLADQPPQVQAGALAELLSLWLAAHPDVMREELLTDHVAIVRELVRLNEIELFGAAGHPANELAQ